MCLYLFKKSSIRALWFWTDGFRCSNLIMNFGKNKKRIKANTYLKKWTSIFQFLFELTYLLLSFELSFKSTRWYLQPTSLNAENSEKRPRYRSKHTSYRKHEWCQIKEKRETKHKSNMRSRAVQHSIKF